MRYMPQNASCFPPQTLTEELTLYMPRSHTDNAEQTNIPAEDPTDPASDRESERAVRLSASSSAGNQTDPRYTDDACG